MRSRRAVGLAEIQTGEVGFGHCHFPVPGLVSSAHTHTFHVSVSAEHQQQRPQERSPASLAPAPRASSRPSPSCSATALATAEFHPDVKASSSFCCQTSPQQRAAQRRQLRTFLSPQGAALGGETASHGDGCERGGTRAGVWATQCKQEGAGFGATQFTHVGAGFGPPSSKGGCKVWATLFTHTGAAQAWWWVEGPVGRCVVAAAPVPLCPGAGGSPWDAASHRHASSVCTAPWDPRPGPRSPSDSLLLCSSSFLPLSEQSGKGQREPVPCGGARLRGDKRLVHV